MQVIERKTTRDNRVIAWMRLARIYTLIDRETVNLLRQFDLSVAQFDVIAQVGAAEGRTQQELADALLVTKGNITQLLDRLEARGLIERRVEAGRRGKRIFLTEAGWMLNREAIPAQEALIASLVGRLPVEDQDDLNQILRRLQQLLASTSHEEHAS